MSLASDHALRFFKAADACLDNSDGIHIYDADGVCTWCGERKEDA